MGRPSIFFITNYVHIGDCLSAYRATIGLFYNRSQLVSINNTFKQKSLTCITIIVILSIIGKVIQYIKINALKAPKLFYCHSELIIPFILLSCLYDILSENNLEYLLIANDLLLISGDVENKPDL